jgi:hypothetical protein
MPWSLLLLLHLLRGAAVAVLLAGLLAGINLANSRA